MITVLVTGDRYWRDKQMILFALSQYAAPVLIVHGGAAGADTLADECARELGFQVAAVPAEWSKYHRAAGPIRNQKMLDDYRPNVGLAFHDDLTNSKGTKDMVGRLKKAGVPYQHFFHS